MKRILLALALTVIAMPLFAADPYKLIARVNGREITNAELDAQWARVPEKLQAQYLKSGGRPVFLDNYISRTLMVQDAVQSGYAKKIGVPAELDAAGESALFDRYVRDVIAAPLITEGEMQKVYADNRAQFSAPEQAHLSIIRALKKENPTAAKEAMAKIVVEVFSERTTIASQMPTDKLLPALAKRFGAIATRVSDDQSAAKGGDLGWVALHTLDPRIANAARSMKPGAISGILESNDAYQIILLHEYHPAGVEPYETAQDAIREYLMAKNSRKVMEAVKQKTAQLRANGKVEVFAENLQ